MHHISRSIPESFSAQLLLIYLLTGFSCWSLLNSTARQSLRAATGSLTAGQGWPSGLLCGPLKFVLIRASIWRGWNVLMLKMWIYFDFALSIWTQLSQIPNFHRYIARELFKNRFVKKSKVCIISYLWNVILDFRVFAVWSFCLNIWVQKSCLMCATSSIKLPKNPDGHRTSYGRTSDIEI